MQLVALIGLLLGLATCGVMLYEWRTHQTLSLHRNRRSVVFLWLERLFIGGLFIFSGFVKANDYIGFSYKLEEYFDVFAQDVPALAGFWHFWASNAEPLAWFIAVFELALAFALIVGYRMNLTLWLTLLMMVFFTFLTGYSWVFNRVTDCGCFGDAIHLAPIESFMKDLILLIMITPLFIVRRQIPPFPNATVAGGVTGSAALLWAIYAWFCHNNLPVVDYLPYKIGTDLRTCTTQTDPLTGETKCKDFDEIYNLGETGDIFVGQCLLVVAYDLTHSDAAALKRTGDLARDLAAQAPNLRTVGLTSTGPDDTKAAIATHALPYPFSLRDQKALKSVLRANPGLVLLRDGVVLAKWHHNNMPAAAEVLSLLK